MDNVIFEPILDKDEVIEKIIKPNKTKKFLSAFLFMFLFFAIIFVPLLLGIVLPDENNETLSNISLIILLGLFLVMLLIVLWFVALSYKNTYYAWTNKRILIRHGIFGVDYKSLDFKMIGAICVNVSVLDKILKKNTGSISYGSMASQISSQSNMFIFAHINKPYECYKEIKEKIDIVKNN